jgi:hypothetical protein
MTGLAGALPDFGIGASGLRYVEHHELVRAALTRARKSPEAWQEAVRFITDEYAGFLSDLPLFQEPEETRWRPTVTNPGGIVAYPYLLERLHAAETLPLLVDVFLREQEAIRESTARMRGDEAPAEDEYFGSFQTVLLAYACDSFLVDFAERSDLREACSDAQRDVLDEYMALREAAFAQWRREVLMISVAWPEDAVRRADAGWGPVYGLAEVNAREQLAAMSFAVRFCGRGETDGSWGQ